jgi:hypothetical protein
VTTTGWGEDATQALVDLETVSGHRIEATAAGVALDGVEIPLPTLRGERAALLGIAGLLPTVPRADDRDKILWRVLGESREGLTPDLWDDPPLDQPLALGLADALPFPEPDARAAISKAMQERFYSSKKVKMLLPLQGTLPMNYSHGGSTGKPARYRMFSGEILPFLLYDEESGEVDRDLLDRLQDLIRAEEDLTALDLLFLQVARNEARYPDSEPDAGALLGRYEDKTRRDLAGAGGAFCSPSLELFRTDLRTVLDTKLPRPDKIQWLTLLLSLHIGTRLYRMADVLGNDLDFAVAAAANIAPPAGVVRCLCDGPGSVAGPLQSCALAGRIRFRTGSGRYRPVSRRDGCRSSYIDLDQRRLLALPATLVTSNLALLAWTALGGPPRHDASMQALGDALRDDSVLRERHSVACAAITVLHHTTHRNAAPLHELQTACGARAGQPGLQALRDDVLRMRRTDLRHQSRDIVNQLLLDIVAGSGSLISRNGTHTFFEVDERLMLLLVRLICKDDPVPYERFLRGLTVYGLSPQDASERAVLSDALERLGLLVRYSDAGEASFVHYA